jgi:hypothetical protein
MSSLICKCGHNQEAHTILKDLFGVTVICERCWEDTTIDDMYICESFRTDNLKYLEQLYEIQQSL